MATLAPSLSTLRDEVDARWPHRDKASDGWLGDQSHATRYSDHNPADPDPPGWVHALDIDATNSDGMGSGVVGDEVLKALLSLVKSGKSHPVNYIIYKGRIYSRSYGFSSRSYTGSNQHYSHIHISINRSSWARQWPGSWGINEKKEWDEVATKAEIKAAVQEVVDAAVSADNASFLNAVRVAIEAEREETAQAVWDRELTNYATKEKNKAHVWLTYNNVKLDWLRGIVDAIKQKVGA